MPVHIVAGGQFGSEGKGAFTVELMRFLQEMRGIVAPTLVRVAGPNAGHTAYDTEGRKWSLRQIPVGAVWDHDSMLILGQQSEIDTDVLFDEINRLEEAGIPIWDRLRVDLQATIIDPEHREQETAILTGTTGKGIGAARAGRLLRKARRAVDIAERLDLGLCDTAEYLRQRMDTGNGTIIVEGTQGYGLGLHAGYYPYCTSSNCRPGDFLAMTGLQPSELNGYAAWLVFRTHPIRIAGDSGPLRGETTWEKIEQNPELTTVTQKVRRVGHWDEALAGAAVTAAGYSNSVLRFVDYMLSDPEDLDSVAQFMHAQEQRFAGHRNVPLYYAGLGPDQGVWRPEGGWLNG